ncbi:MAG: hypothetical protein GY804_04350 [Alphaproteobacteria bacterium]|nr:hypothetical protein [Alphaproteobacteria bacterium]
MFYASSNTEMFPDGASRIRKCSDTFKFISKLRNYDWEQFFSLPKSGLVPVRLSYARFLVAKDNMMLSACTSEFSKLPDWLRHNKYVCSSDKNLGKNQCDKLCVFKALSEHFFRMQLYQFGRRKNTIKKKMFAKFIKHFRKPQMKPREFDGVTQSELPYIERLFSVKINVFLFESKGKASPNFPKGLKATPIYFSQLKNSINGQCNLLRYLDHVCYIRDLDRAMGILVCSICERKQTDQNYGRHFKACSRGFKNNGRSSIEQIHKYHDAELFKVKLDIFEEIQQHCNIRFPQKMKNVNYLTF